MEEYAREPCPWRIIDDCGGKSIIIDQIKKSNREFLFSHTYGMYKDSSCASVNDNLSLPFSYISSILAMNRCFNRSCQPSFCWWNNICIVCYRVFLMRCRTFLDCHLLLSLLLLLLVVIWCCWLYSLPTDPPEDNFGAYGAVGDFSRLSFFRQVL